MKLPAKLPVWIRDNAVVAGCLAASVLFNLLLVAVAQKAASRGGVIVVAVPAGKPAALPPGTVQAPPGAKPAKPEAVPDEKPQAKPKEKPPAQPPEKKAPPKRVVQEKKPQAAPQNKQAKPGNADLVPLACEAPEPMGVEGAQLLRIEIENRGTESAGPHHDALFFSQDDHLDAKDAPLGMIEAGGELPAGAKRWLRSQVLLPDKTPSGRGYLIIVLNADGQMPETNHANNQLVVPVMVDASSSPLGDPNARPRTTVAWISSKDLRELKARQSVTLQPDVQNETEAQKQAKLHNQPGAKDAKPEPGQVKPKTAEPVAKAPEKTPAPPADKARDKQEKAVALVKKETPKPEAKAGPGPVIPPKVAVGPKPDAAPGKPAEQPVDKKKPGRAAPAKEIQVARAPGQKPEVVPVPKERGGAKTQPGAQPEPEKTPQDGGEKKQVAASPDTPSAPAPATAGEGATATPRDTSSAPATQLEESDLERQPGGVLVGQGIKVNTVRIRPPGPAAQYQGVSHNPRAAVTFNAQGRAVKVDIIGKSGNDDWDEAVRQSLILWTAEGDKVKDGGLVLRWTVILGGQD